MKAFYVEWEFAQGETYLVRQWGLQSQTGYQDGLRSAKNHSDRQRREENLRGEQQIATSCTEFLHRFDRLFQLHPSGYQEIRFFGAR